MQDSGQESAGQEGLQIARRLGGSRPPAILTFVPLLPAGREDVELVPLLGVLVRAEDERFSVRRKLGEAGETAERGDLFQAGAVDVDQVELELAAVAFVLVA